MKLRFVSHASFSVHSRNTTLLTDPWLCGMAFNQGWALLSPAAPVFWPKIDYVWISHQHPDHLNFPTLRSIDPAERRRFTVLYQKHASLRISKVLRGLGFTNVCELPLQRWIALRDGIEVMCGSVGAMDSWIAIRADGVTVLNLNDCIMTHRHLARIARLVGRVDVLLTQFSFAQWIGNHADESGEAGRKLRELRFRVHYFRPDFTVPFASFIYFASQENCWMNAFSVTPRRVMEMDLPGVNFMYPGDEWDSNVRSFRSAEAVRKYMEDVTRPKPILPTPPPVNPATIRDGANRILQTLRSQFSRFLIDRIRPESFYLHDIDQVLLVNPAGACEVMPADDTSRSNARFVLCSQMAWYAFSYFWGWDAMEVSGMYFDRRWREPWPLARCFRALNSDILNFRGARQSMRTLGFLWTKRHEIGARMLSNVVGDSPKDLDLPKGIPFDGEKAGQVFDRRAG